MIFIVASPVPCSSNGRSSGQDERRASKPARWGAPALRPAAHRAQAFREMCPVSRAMTNTAVARDLH
jgi:hypothetical protein